MTDTLRTRIAAAIYKGCDNRVSPGLSRQAADAVIRELDDALLNFGSWLAEEITGRTMTRIDLESCLQEWKWLNDESRWLKGEGDD